MLHVDIPAQTTISQIVHTYMSGWNLYVLKCRLDLVTPSPSQIWGVWRHRWVYERLEDRNGSRCCDVTMIERHTLLQNPGETTAAHPRVHSNRARDMSASLLAVSTHLSHI